MTSNDAAGPTDSSTRPTAIARLAAEGFAVQLSARDHEWTSDEPSDRGGEDLGPTPTEMAMAALGACTAITLRLYARRKGWPLEGVSIESRLEEANREGGRVSCRVRLEGPLDDEQRARLLQIAAACPVHRLLERPTRVETTLDAATETEAK